MTGREEEPGGKEKAELKDRERGKKVKENWTSSEKITHRM